jgi:hypothetical protein
MSRIAFVSGHVEIEQADFILHYKAELDKAVAEGHHFVIGNAKGVDTLALQYLLVEQKVDPKSITVFVFDRYRNQEEIAKLYQEKCKVHTRTGFASYTDRDKAMTLASDYDIAWVRDVETAKKLYGQDWTASKKSGTQLNLERRINVCSS